MHVGFGWLSDIQFRPKMAVSPESMSYAVIDQELWLLYMGPAANSLNGNRKCYDFNFRSCSRVGCSYRHGCLNCSVNHPAKRCWTQNNNRGPPPARGAPVFAQNRPFVPVKGQETSYVQGRLQYRSGAQDSKNSSVKENKCLHLGAPPVNVPVICSYFTDYHNREGANS